MLDTSLMIVLIGLSIMLSIWALVDITKTRFKNPIVHIFLLMLIQFFPVLGPIFYFQYRRKLIKKASSLFESRSKRML
jgi:glucan phosphoethanolaminetransferase (alkaline phosphatase superfamily)